MTHKNKFKITYGKLSEIAVLSFKNGYRLHNDSVRLFTLESYPSAVLLSILAMEEFGKYFSLSSYVFYNRANDNRDEDYEKKYLQLLYNHPFKQSSCFGRDGFEPSQELYDYAMSRKYEDLKQSTLYVGLKREKGEIIYDSISNPFNITQEMAESQIIFLNDLLVKMVEVHIEGVTEYDENEINEFLSKNLLTTLKSFEDKVSSV